MAASNFPSVMDEIFKHEGGYVDHPNDPGGETNYGISKRAHPRVNIAALTKSKAREIYRTGYWNPIKGDQLPYGVDLAVMDPAVNSGTSRGVRWMQKAVGASADGKMGPKTLAAITAADPTKAIQKACAARMGFLRGLRTWSSFGKGWSRRVASVEAVAVRMSTGNKAEVVKAEKGAKKSADANTAAGGGVVAGGGGTISMVDLPAYAPWAIGIVVILIAIQFAGRARHDKNRAAAYRENAK